MLCWEQPGAEPLLAECTDLDCPAAIQSSWPSGTGWLDGNGAPIEMQFVDGNGTDVIYQCRTGHVDVVGDVPFSNCDGATGTSPVHRPQPTVGMEQGHYVTHMRITDGSFTSRTLEYPFYAHGSLNSVPRCPAAFSDETIFAKAKQELPEEPPFSLLAGVEPTRTVNPFIRILFENVIIPFDMRSDQNGLGNGTWADASVETQLLVGHSLRRRFVFNNDRTLLLVQRRYQSRQALAHGVTDPDTLCRNGFVFGRNNPNTPGHGKATVDCENFVLNSRGQGVCLIQDGEGSDAQLVTRLSTSVGWVKLRSKGAFSAKGPQDICPNDNNFFPRACNWYLHLPN